MPSTKILTKTQYPPKVMIVGPLPSLVWPYPPPLDQLIQKGQLKPLNPTPPPNPFPKRYNPTKYYAFHQGNGHEIDHYIKFHHEIQDLIDKKVIAPPPTQSNIIHNPFPNHHAVPPPQTTNHIDLDHSAYNPTICITSINEPELISILVKDTKFVVWAIVYHWTS